jgi:hypothetical protein
VLVTIIIALVSVWVAPALTRQWDDRQKAHELSASIVSQMAAATAPALLAGQEGLFGRNPRGKQVVRSWALASLEIETRLAAYFPESLVDSWRAFTDIVAGMLERMLVPEASPYNFPTAPEARLKALEKRPPFSNAIDGIYEVASSRSEYEEAVRANGAYEEASLQLSTSWREQERRLLAIQQGIAEDALKADLAGYSTTRQDLLRELLP